MTNDHRISLRTLVYCLLTGRDQISESAIPDAPEAFEGANPIIPDIIDAASRGRIMFHGIPTQTRFPISERRFEDMPDRAIMKAISFLNRLHELPVSDEKRNETHVSERYLASGHEPVPREAWRIDCLAWAVDQLLIWNSAEIDQRFSSSDPAWVENPFVQQPISTDIDVTGNPYLAALPQYDPLETSGYSSLRCDVSAVNLCKQLYLDKPEALSSKRTTIGEGGRPKLEVWAVVEHAAEALLEQGAVPQGSWGAVLNAAINEASKGDISVEQQQELNAIKLDSWKRHLKRTHEKQGCTLMARLDTERNRSRD